MEEKRVELKELKNDLIRCVIPYKEDDKEKQIEVYNIIGDRRYQIIDELKEVLECNENEMEYANDFYYKTLIMEFTDLKVDEIDINEILINPRFEFQILKHELDDMMYEIQYEIVCNKIRENRVLMLNDMNKQLNEEFKSYEIFINKSDERINKLKEVGDSGIQ